MSEQVVWEEILRQHGLGEDRGHNPKWLRYGARYFDHDHSITYDSAEKRPDPRTAKAITKGLKIAQLVKDGLSRRKAALQLGIPWKSARYALRLYEKSTWVTSDTSSEGIK